jgi:hypothetical protein
VLVAGAERRPPAVVAVHRVAAGPREAPPSRRSRRRVGRAVGERERGERRVVHDDVAQPRDDAHDGAGVAERRHDDLELEALMGRQPELPVALRRLVVDEHVAAHRGAGDPGAQARRARRDREVAATHPDDDVARRVEVDLAGEQADVRRRRRDLGARLHVQAHDRDRARGVAGAAGAYAERGDGVAAGEAVVALAVGGERVDRDRRHRAAGGGAAPAARRVGGGARREQALPVQHRHDPPGRQRGEHRRRRHGLPRAVADGVLLVEPGARPPQRRRDLLDGDDRLGAVVAAQGDRDLRLDVRAVRPERRGHAVVARGRGDEGA